MIKITAIAPNEELIGLFKETFEEHKKFEDKFHYFTNRLIMNWKLLLGMALMK